MDAIYIYDGEFAKGDAGFPLIRMAAARHCMECGIDFDPEKAEIIRDEKRKPYFTNIPLEFSLTHSGQLWMCMFSDRPCGLDLQEIRNCDHEKMAERFFHPDEAEYVREHGQEAFFDIWVRKEAYCKMTGEGLFGSEMPSVLEEKGVFRGKAYCFREIEISDDMRCCVCTEDGAEPVLRALG